jgi:hypothetical protein
MKILTRSTLSKSLNGGALLCRSPCESSYLSQLICRACGLKKLLFKHLEALIRDSEPPKSNQIEAGQTKTKTFTCVFLSCACHGHGPISPTLLASHAPLVLLLNKMASSNGETANITYQISPHPAQVAIYEYLPHAHLVPAFPEACFISCEHVVHLKIYPTRGISTHIGGDI